MPDEFWAAAAVAVIAIAVYEAGQRLKAWVHGDPSIANRPQLQPITPQQADGIVAARAISCAFAPGTKCDSFVHCAIAGCASRRPTPAPTPEHWRMLIVADARIDPGQAVFLTRRGDGAYLARPLDAVPEDTP